MTEPVDISFFILASFGCGLAATLIMTALELFYWKKWGIEGVFEWHENKVIMSKILKLKKYSNAGIFLLHFLNGGLGGVGFFILDFALNLPHEITFLSLIGAGYGVILWIITLIPIHKPITGYSPWNHPLGHSPALASLAGHLLYGVTLALIYSALF